LAHPLQQSLVLVQPQQVHADRQVPGRIRERGDDRVHLARVEVHRADPRPGAGEGLSDSAADAARCPVTTTPRSSRPAPILHAMALASIDATGSIVARGGSRPPVARGVARVESWYNHTRARQTRAPGKKTMADT